MAEKNSTLILKVDLECSRCRKEISRVLFKLQGKENIKTISYDEKNNTVTISGPFDPQRLSAKLTCRAGRIIKDIQIKEPKKEEKPKETKPTQTAPAEKEKTKKEEKPAGQPKKEEKPADKEKKPDKPPEKKPEKDDEKPSKTKSEPVQVPQPVHAHQPTCCPAPYYEGYYGGCRCCMCGHIFGYTAAPPYRPHYAPPYDGYRVYHCSDEYPTSSCTIM